MQRAHPYDTRGRNMKVLALTLLVVSLAICTPKCQAEPKTMLDLGMDIFTRTLPCTAPCLMKNLGAIAEEANKTCVTPLIAKMQSVLNASMVSPPQPQYVPGQATPSPGVNMAYFQSLMSFLDSKKICPPISEVIQCTSDIARKYCKDDLTNALVKQFEEGMEYYGCGDPNSNKVSMIKCLAGSKETLGVLRDCGEKITDHNTTKPLLKLLTTMGYRDIYTDILVRQSGETYPKICEFAHTYMTCMTDGLRSLNEPACSSTTIDLIQTEVNALLDLVNCRKHKEKNDGLTCLAKPELILDSIAPCVGNFSMENLQKSITAPQPGQPLSKLAFDFDKLCDLVTLMDGCIEDKLVAEKACEKNGWTITTYRAVITPFRDHLLRGPCKNLGKHPSNPRSDGQCKNKFSDYPYGRADNAASSVSGSAPQLISTIICVWTVWVLNK